MSWSGYIPASLLSADEFDPGFDSDDFDWDDFDMGCGDDCELCNGPLQVPDYGEEASYP